VSTLAARLVRFAVRNNLYDAVGSCTEEARWLGDGLRGALGVRGEEP
jgi:hypothetical protein